MAGGLFYSQSPGNGCVVSWGVLVREFNWRRRKVDEYTASPIACREKGKNILHSQNCWKVLGLIQDWMPEGDGMFVTKWNF